MRIGERAAAAAFLSDGRVASDMQSVRKGLRSGAIVKDTYERLTCADCEETLKTENDPDELGAVRVCPECGKQWKKIG